MIIDYKIYPTIAYDGTPTYSLFVGSIKIAENADRSVLEKAIEHLKNAT